MMKRLVFTLLVAGVLSMSAKAETFNVGDFFSKSDAFFKKYVSKGLVDYKSIKGNLGEIESLYTTINEANVAELTDQERKAFYINAYNLIVIYQVSKYYPLKSAMDQSGFFDKVKHNVAGTPMTLNSLEIKKLIMVYKDPRIHFVLACAAVSCPPLANFAYVPGKIDQQLDDRTRMALNNSSWLIIKAEQKKVLLSKIFDWYKKDFTMNDAHSVIEFINKYRDKPIPSAYEIGYYEYDWSLNERG